MPSQTDPLALGATLTILGMGGTLLVLFALSLLVSVLKRLFPLRHEAPTPASVPPPPSTTA